MNLGEFSSGDSRSSNEGGDPVFPPVENRESEIGNRQWGQRLIQNFSRLGVELFCFSPGARSSPLVAALGSVKSLSHFDERGMAFFALGAARASGKPVVAITTSGTAVANLLPAVVEAFYSHVPLIVITADRPPELQDRGANQTILQPGMFTNYVRWEVESACPDGGIFADELDHICHEAWRQSTGVPPGPVHVNVPFREPLLEGDLE